MVKDITTLQLTINATNVANQMKESGYFEDSLSAAKFGMAYAVKYYFDEIGTSPKIEALDDIYNPRGLTYNAGSVDSDGFMSRLIMLLYPQCNTPYKYMRVLMRYGLNKLGDLLEEGRLFPISDSM